jgi:hypothetical protein
MSMTVLAIRAFAKAAVQRRNAERRMNVPLGDIEKRSDRTGLNNWVRSGENFRIVTTPYPRARMR